MASNKNQTLSTDNEYTDHAYQLLLEIIQKQHLTAVFQPIIDIRKAVIVGYEGLIRGPSDTLLHSPISLFSTARHFNLASDLEYLCRHVVLRAFAQQALPGKLFLNVSPDVLTTKNAKSGETLKYIDEIGLSPNDVIIELTENTLTLDYDLLREATEHYRQMGFEIAIDDLGEGFSGLRLWSEIRPDYVKIDKHFIHEINIDPVKLQFVRSIQEIAGKSSAKVIAEGIETHAELITISDIGIDYGQGYFIARPHSNPFKRITTEVSEQLLRAESSRSHAMQQCATVERLLKKVISVEPSQKNDEVYKLFEHTADLYSIPVTRSGKPIGLISRFNMIDRFARPYRRELYGRRSCEMMMDDKPLIVEKSVGLLDLSDIIIQSEPHHLSVGFIITDNGRYAGMGSGHDLLKLITQMQIQAARYANPLTMLPGNVPIYEHIERLLQSKLGFVACYCDLDHFKPYNDVYGYQKGDEVIEFSGKHLKDICNQNRDFLGHIGGDDFIILFLSEDWEYRCQTALARFKERIQSFYTETDRKLGRIETEDRQGRRSLIPLVSLSIGAVVIEPDQFKSHHEVAAAAAVAKKQAKKISGNSIFIERRTQGQQDPLFPEIS